jgi:hypothetical protein
VDNIKMSETAEYMDLLRLQKDQQMLKEAVDVLLIRSNYI